MKVSRKIFSLVSVAAVATALSAFDPLLAKTISAQRLPAWETVGTEVSTNMSFVTQRTDVHRFSVAMDFVGTASNCVQMAFGTDANGDGDLAPGETDFVVGWRAGSYFLDDSASGARHNEVAAMNSAPMRRFVLHVELDASRTPRSAYASDNMGTHYFADVLATHPVWLFNTGWNLCKVTRRGMDEPQEWCRAEKSFGYFYLRIR